MENSKKNNKKESASIVIEKRYADAIKMNDAMKDAGLTAKRGNNLFSPNPAPKFSISD